MVLTLGGAYVGLALNTDLDESVFLKATGDRTTRLFYQDEAGNFAELAEDRISGSENALYCPLEQMTDDLKNAFIAIEDKRFYDHGGIDWLRTFSAAENMIKKEKGHFGGSTITQQLVKNLTGEDQRSVKRKIAEMIRAAKLEEHMSKDRILEQYLNVVNLAEGCYGVKTAANAYFSKEPNELTLREAATIAAITNNPTRYDPIRCPESNRQRRDLILAQMLEQGMIDNERYTEAAAEETALFPNERALSVRINSWFADLAVRDVIRDLVNDRGMSEAAASRLVYSGGLRIYTTVDPKLQGVVEAYYRETEHFPLHQGEKRAQSAMMILDPTTGGILAVVGATGEKQGNRLQSYASDATRPSGSVIKPLSVYAPALERGLITWSTVFDDVPYSFKANGAPWPRNAPDVYRGLTTVSTALEESVNTVSVSILQRLGKHASFAFLHDQLCFSSLQKEQDGGSASLALGQQSEGVTLAELLGGYTILANGGVYTGCHSYTRVEDHTGSVLLEQRLTPKRVLSPETAAIMTLLLRRVVQSGTGRGLRLKDVVDVAGKTGTSGNSCDKWFLGYTPELLAGVWYGHEYPESLADVGGNPALRIFDEVMADVLRIRPPLKKSLETEADLVAVRYCKDSGKLVKDICMLDPRGDRTEIGYFKKGTEPTQLCDCHTAVRYCLHGGVACETCPEETCITVALLRVLRSFPRQIRVLDAPYTCWGNPPKTEHNLLYNEPYYAETEDSITFYGIAKDLHPFNAACTGHAASEEFWKRREEVFDP